MILLKQRYGNKYKEYYSYYMSKNDESLEEAKREQGELFVDFVNFTFNSSPFYRKLYDAAGIDISQVITLADIKRLPIVDKELLRANISSVYTIDPSDGVTAFTGGTTGKSLEVVFTNEDVQHRNAYFDVFKSKVGVDVFKVRKATFSGREILPQGVDYKGVFWRDNKAYKQRLFSTFHMTEINLHNYIKGLNQFKPDVINGFVSAIYDLAKYIEMNDLSLAFKLQAIFTTSETLLHYHREVIERVFQCKIYNQYASAEGAPFITECKSGKLHYNLDTGIIEINEETGSILVTSFTSHGTPLIRYDIGDEVIFSQEKCNCGSVHPIVSEVRGRKADFITTPNGNKVSLCHLADVIKGIPNCVKKVQFIQLSTIEIVVKLAVDDSAYKVEYDKKILDAMKFRFGDGMTISLKKVDDIPKEKSGKYALIKKAQSL